MTSWYDKCKELYSYHYDKIHQDVDQKNDAKVDQSAAIEQVALVDQELNQAVVQNNEQTNLISVEGSGNGGDGGGGGGGGGIDADLLELLLDADLPPGQLIRAIELLVGDGGGGGGGAGDGGDVNVVAINENDQVGFNIGGNFSDIDQDQEDLFIEQDQDVEIGQENFNDVWG